MSDYQEYTVRVYAYCIAWYQNDKLHREDGPAIEYADGRKEWWQDDKLHRLDGPAIDRANGTKEWWIYGVNYTEDEFNHMTNPVKELTVAQIQDMLGFPIKVVKG